MKPSRPVPDDLQPTGQPMPRLGVIVLVLLIGVTVMGLVETNRRNRLADWHAQQANSCGQAALEFEERAEALHDAGHELDAEYCLRSATIFTREQTSHDQMAMRLRRPFWEDWFKR